MNHADLQIHWVDSPAEFASACAELRLRPFVSIDTEFVRTRTFYAQLGLIQIYDGAICRLIDPLAIGDFGPLAQLLCDPGVTKVIHSGSEDFEIFHRCVDAPLAGFFDTQIAAALSGMGPSLSYQALVSKFAGIDLSKGETRSNWLRRPLSPTQLTYAAHDVEYLLQIHQVLADRLQQLQRSAWAEEDVARASAPPLSAEQSAVQQYRRLKFAWKLTAAQQSVALELLTWREYKARQIDRPRNRLIDENAIYAIAASQPRSMQQLAQCANLNELTLQRNGRRLLEIVSQALTKTEVPPAPQPPLEHSARSQVNHLRSIVKRRADELDLAPEVLCGRRNLIYLMQNRRLPKLLCGWRRVEIGDELLTALEREPETAERSFGAPSR